jgi:hypothetical protein
MTVFLDTVGLLAVWDESDPWHPAAQVCFSELLGCRADILGNQITAVTVSVVRRGIDPVR